MIFILLAYTFGYIYCLHCLPINTTNRDLSFTGLITIVLQLTTIMILSFFGTNIVLIYLISIEMLVSIIYFFTYKHSIEQLPAVLFVFVMSLLFLQISELTLFQILHLPYIVQERSILWIIVNTVVTITSSIIISKTLYFLSKKFKLSTDLLNKNDNLKISCLMLTMIIAFFIYLDMSDKNSVGLQNRIITQFYLLMIITVFTVTIISIFWISRKITIEKLDYEIIINSQLKEYLNSLEVLEKEQRQFRHDFVNIYGSLSGYIENNDMNGLKKYYYKEIEHINLEQNQKSFQLKSLVNMKIIEIKGLIALKVTKAESLGIKINIEIFNPVYEIFMNTSDFNKCLGILLDNAIEEVANLNKEKRYIDIVILDEKSQLTLFIKNPLSKEVNIDSLFIRGYSTKGKNRGLGLSEVESIVNNEKQMSLETSIEENIFIQKIIIKKEE